MAHKAALYGHTNSLAWGVILSVRFKNLCISHVGILSWGNLIYTNSYIDFSVHYIEQAFFLTSASKKAKTQAQNSSQKLKKKTQPQGGSFLPSRKTQGKNSILRILLKKLKGYTFYAIFIIKYFQNQYILNEN